MPSDLLTVITPVLHLFYRYLDDESAFRLFGSHRSFSRIKTVYNIKKHISLRTSPGQDFTLLHKWNRLFPISLFPQVVYLKGYYSQISRFLDALEIICPEYKDKCALKYVIVTHAFNSNKIPAFPRTLLSLSLYCNPFAINVRSIPCLSTLCPRLKTLFLYDDVCEVDIPIGYLPKTVTKLTLSRSRRLTPLSTVGVLPPSLTYLDCNTKIGNGVLPDSIKTLILPVPYNHSLPHILPCSLITLVLGDTFNQPLHHPFPSSLKKLTLSGNFDQILYEGILNEGLVSLTLGFHFNQSFGLRVLPNSLTELHLGYFYNQPFAPTVLPDSLTTLRLHNRFNQPLTNENLPKNLSCLSFSKYSDFNHILEVDHFRTLSCLILPFEFSEEDLVGDWNSVFPTLAVVFRDTTNIFDSIIDPSFSFAVVGGTNMCKNCHNYLKRGGVSELHL
jgi:FNIP Repeat